MCIATVINQFLEMMYICINAVTKHTYELCSLLKIKTLKNFKNTHYCCLQDH